MKLRYAVVFEQTPNNYGAYVPDVPGCVSRLPRRPPGQHDGHATSVRGQDAMRFRHSNQSVGDASLTEYGRDC